MKEAIPDFRSLLRTALANRQLKNPNYSQRAFARDLGLSPSSLCDVLNGRQGLSAQRARGLANRLGLFGEKAEYFSTLVASQHARASGSRLAAKEQLKILKRRTRHRQLSPRDFSLVSDWHFYAVAELLKTKDCDQDPARMAAALNISRSTLLEALRRLSLAGIIQKAGDKWITVTANTLVPGRLSSERIRRFHASVLQLAAEAQERQTVEEKEFSTLILAVDQSRIAEAKLRLCEMLQDFDAEFGSSPEADRVYGLSLQLFRMSSGGENV